MTSMRGKAPRCTVSRLAIVLAIAMLPRLLAQTASSSQELLIELAEKLAARVSPSNRISLNVTGRGDDGRANTIQLRAELVAALGARGVRVVDGSTDAVQVDVTCGTNLRERTCVADVRNGTARDVIAESRPHASSAQHTGAMPLSLEWRPVIAQRDPILDVALAGDRLFVLEPNAVVTYQRREAGWHRTQTTQIPPSRTWPRDLRGRLWIAGDGVEVRLPGVSCRAGLDLGNLACAEDREAWPIGIDNAGLDAARNYFTTPEGLPFFGAAPVGAAGEARWLIADRSGLLTLLDGARRTLATAGPGDDVVAIAAACAPGPHVLVAAPSERQHNTDTLRLLRVADNRIVPASSPLDLAAAVTALWAAPNATAATAVIRDTGGERYEAVHILIACDR